MPHEVLEDGKRGGLDVSVSPVDPAMRRPQGSTQQPIPGLGHELPSRGLGGKAVSALDVLVDLLAKVLLDDRDLAVRLPRVRVVLQLLQQLRQQARGVVLRVRDQEGQVDEVVRVGEVAQMREEHGQVRRGVSQRRAQQDSLLALPPPRRPLDVRQVVVADGLELEVV